LRIEDFGLRIAEKEAMRKNQPSTASRIEATPNELVLFVRGKQVRIPWEKCSPKLAAATVEQRINAQLSPGGYGIHWPMLDEDLSINGLLREAS
jgi:hypothetical protein